MTTQTITTHADPCPGCDRTDRTYWVASTPDSDTWACRECGTEWTITVHVPGVGVMTRPDGLYQVTTRYLCAGFVVENGRVTWCAPILRRRLPYWRTVARRVGS